MQLINSALLDLINYFLQLGQINSKNGQQILDYI